MSNEIVTDQTRSLGRSGGRRRKGSKWAGLDNVRRQNGVSSAIASAQTVLQDEDLKLHVYKKVLQAYIYPITGSTPHKFGPWNAKRPTYCYECGGLLWGIARQGLRCNDCGVKCHERCQDLLNADCLQKAAFKSSRHGAVDKTQSIIMAMKEKMKDREHDKKEVFELIRKFFNIPSERHKKHLAAAKQCVLDGTSKWSAKLDITVVEARGLQAKDKTGTSDPYVTLDVGKQKKRTKTIQQRLNPDWDESFSFECHDSSDRIKIRVWDEDDDFKSALKKKLIRESDDFLGQALIDLHTLSADMDNWYNLEKRTDRSVVSGSVHLKINLVVKGEEKLAPYHLQYTCLHETIFHQIVAGNNNQLVYPDQRGVENGWMIFFEKDPQDVLTEFSKRYGIDSIFQAMTHFSCISTCYDQTGGTDVMNILLLRMTNYYKDSETKASGGKFAQCKFGKDEFTKLLKQLMNSLRIDINNYRRNFPPYEKDRMSELRKILELMNSIDIFLKDIAGVSAATRNAAIIGCVKACALETYEFLFKNCNQLVKDIQNDGTETVVADDEGVVEEGPSLESLEFWMNMLTLIFSIIEEDKVAYGEYLDRFMASPAWQFTTSELWKIFVIDLETALNEHTTQKRCKTTEYMNLQFRVKILYTNYVSKLANKAQYQPEFYSWFKEFTFDWLDDNESLSVDFMKGSFKRDLDDKFPQTSEHALFSYSVVDVFSHLSQSLGIITKLGSPPDVTGEYLAKFAKTVGTVLLTYASQINECFSDFHSQVEVCCTLMNNIQQSRVLLQKLYASMGGDELVTSAAKYLSDLQATLSEKLGDLSVKFAEGYRKTIAERIRTLAEILYTVRGSYTITNTNDDLTTESDVVLKPLVDVLDSCFSVFARSSEKTILKRMLKEMWVLVIKSLEQFIVLPEEYNENDRNHVQTLSPRQCAVLENAIELLKDYFHASGNGMKHTHIEKSMELRKIEHALELYTQTTDSLIKTFIKTQNEQDKLSRNNMVGEVSLQIDLRTHPGSGEHKLTVKVLAAKNLSWKMSSMFRPFVEISIIGPHLESRRRSFETKGKSREISPHFDETFYFDLSNEADPNEYEVQVCAKDYCFAREDKVIGVGVLQLNGIVKLSSLACWCPLADELYLEQTGRVVLKILSTRVGDHVAKDFVRLKSTTRSPQES